MWTPTTRQKYSRPTTRYQTDLTDAEWSIIEPFLPLAKATALRQAQETPRLAPARDPERHLLRAARRHPVAPDALRSAAVANSLDGMFATDKFCMTRHSTLRLPSPRGTTQTAASHAQN